MDFLAAARTPVPHGAIRRPTGRTRVSQNRNRFARRTSLQHTSPASTSTISGSIPLETWAACAASEVVQTVTFTKPIGDAKLFEVTTDLGVRRVVATDASSARRMIEDTT